MQVAHLHGQVGARGGQKSEIGLNGASAARRTCSRRAHSFISGATSGGSGDKSSLAASSSPPRGLHLHLAADLASLISAPNSIKIRSSQRTARDLSHSEARN